MFADLRAFVEACREIGELREIHGADWDLEIGGLTELVAEERGPALPLRRHPRLPPRLSRLHQQPRLGAPHGAALRLAARRRPAAASARLSRLVAHRAAAAPARGGRGAFAANAFRGSAVDLGTLPGAALADLDGGRYIGTACAVVTRDPDSGAENTGIYRCQIQAPNLLTIKFHQGRHASLAMRKYHARGEPCPVAVSFGHEPSLFLAAMTPVPTYGGEYDLAGAIRGEPLPVVRLAESGVRVPATAEIVAEGFIDPVVGERAHDFQEGPLGNGPATAPAGRWATRRSCASPPSTTATRRSSSAVRR